MPTVPILEGESLQISFVCFLMITIYIMKVVR